MIALESGRDTRTTGEAIEREARELVGKQPDQASLRVQLGAALLAQGKADEAETEFRAALKLNGRYTPAFLGLGQIALQRGKFEDALEFVQHALRTNPNDLQANLIAGQLRRRGAAWTMRRSIMRRFCP